MSKVGANCADAIMEMVTALELKTGREQNAHRGQVILYHLLLTERFLNSNPKNILMYV